MYNWRHLSESERQEVLAYRKKANLPWHSPPHFVSEHNIFLLTGANYLHQCIIGQTIERMLEFQKILLDTLLQHTVCIYAWCVLPNHYHALILTNDLKYTIYGLGQMHGRSSRAWNLEDNTKGRQCWHGCNDRAIRSQRHLCTATNYVHYNPVKHHLVEKLDEWVFSSASEYLEEVGRKKAVENWKMYPLLDFGKGWDDFKIEVE